MKPVEVWPCFITLGVLFYFIPYIAKFQPITGSSEAQPVSSKAQPGGSKKQHIAKGIVVEQVVSIDDVPDVVEEYFEEVIGLVTNNT